MSPMAGARTGFAASTEDKIISYALGLVKVSYKKDGNLRKQ